ncbi:MAG: PAS domain-containing protein [Pontiellaceae bacterium]|nr:PAS domain-containing protein [Pontiellaceae bacterium]
MSTLPTSIIFTQETTLLQRFRGFLHSRSDILHVTEPEALELILHQYNSSLLFIDLCAPKGLQLIEKIRATFPAILIIALGAARSEPALRAAALNIYAVENPEPDRVRLQSLFDQAQSHLRLLNENRVLRETLIPSAPQPEPPRENIVPSLHHFSKALRRFDNVGETMEGIVEGVAACARVSRVAVFSLTSDDAYAFRSGIKCMEETRSLTFRKTHPFVRWLQIHAHSISRSMLRHIDSVDERLLIEKALDQTGAEVILPMFGRERLNGWLCIGRACSGAPFSLRDIEELTVMTEQVSVAIENSLLHESIALQKAMAENLLQAIPVGIVATGQDGTVRWFNSGAERLLGRSANELIGQPVEKVSSTIASMIHRGMSGKGHGEAQEWTEPSTQQKISVQVRKLEQDDSCVGAMAVLNDLTHEYILRERQNNLERARFWTELATAISHEVRNPLVAISTFAQLLPERYAEEEFRDQFQKLVSQEVNRLNGMISQLDEYANPPTLSSSNLNVADLLKAATKEAQKDQDNKLPIATVIAEDLPSISGDHDVLSNSIARVLHNAFSAVKDSARPIVTLRAYQGELGIDRTAVVIEISDNGPGIPEEMQANVFSPFCSTSARGIGLGLPIVRRTMIDHGGLIAIDSSTNGTTVKLTLPVANK